MNNIELSKETRQDLINMLQQFFWDEREETISAFQATAILDFLINNIGPIIYNQALADAHALMLNKIEDLYGLEKRPR